MSKMKELYEKVAADSILQEKFSRIIAAAEKENRETTEAKLVSFAKEAGYDITMEEFAAYTEQQGELSESELDAVAGGKSVGRTITAVVTGLGLGTVSMYNMLMEQGCAGIPGPNDKK